MQKMLLGWLLLISLSFYYQVEAGHMIPAKVRPGYPDRCYLLWEDKYCDLNELCDFGEKCAMSRCVLFNNKLHISYTDCSEIYFPDTCHYDTHTILSKKYPYCCGTLVCSYTKAGSMDKLNQFLFGGK